MMVSAPLSHSLLVNDTFTQERRVANSHAVSLSQRPIIIESVKCRRPKRQRIQPTDAASASRRKLLGNRPLLAPLLAPLLRVSRNTESEITSGEALRGLGSASPIPLRVRWR